MSWTSEGYFSAPNYNQSSYEHQYQSHQSEPYAQYSQNNFYPSPYNHNNQMNHNQFYCPNEFIQSVNSSIQNNDGIDEPPLLEELGINFEHIFRKTLAVLNPFAKLDMSIIDDVDLAGPLVFCLAYASSLLLLGKIHFGYVYGIVSLGTVGMYSLLNLMASPDKPCSGVFVTSVLGYCLLPMVILSFASFLFQLNGFLGMITAVIFVLWCSISASKLFSTSLAMIGQQFLVAYPCALFYGVFVLLTMF